MTKCEEDQDAASDVTSSDGDPSGDYKDVTIPESKAMIIKKRKSTVFNSPAYNKLRTALNIVPDQIDQRLRSHGIFIDRKLLYKDFVRASVVNLKSSVSTEKESTSVSVSEEDSILVGDEPTKRTVPETSSHMIGLDAYITGLIQPTEEDNARREEALMAGISVLSKCNITAKSTVNPYYTSS